MLLFARDMRVDELTEIKTTLSGRVDRFICEVVERSDREVVVLYRIPAARALHGVWLPAGTVTVGYFWCDRPYNLYHWVAADGTTLAHYFNIGDVTRYAGATLEWHDLTVDVLATPDGRVQVLDEDELPPTLDPSLRRYVEAGRDEVLRDLPSLIRDSELRSAQILRPASPSTPCPAHQPPAAKPAINR